MMTPAKVMHIAFARAVVATYGGSRVAIDRLAFLGSQHHRSEELSRAWRDAQTVRQLKAFRADLMQQCADELQEAVAFAREQAT